MTKQNEDIFFTLEEAKSKAVVQSSVRYTSITVSGYVRISSTQRFPLNTDKWVELDGYGQKLDILCTGVRRCIRCSLWLKLLDYLPAFEKRKMPTAPVVLFDR